MIEKIFNKDRLKRAKKLIDKQIESGAGNFNNIEFLIYKNEQKQLDLGNVLNDFVENNSFYNHHVYLKSRQYNIANGLKGTRKFHFQEKESLLLYTCIGLYLLELTDPLKKEVQSNIDYTKKVKTFYGANIKVDEIEKSVVTYQEDYTNFLQTLKRFTAEVYDKGHSFFVLKLDIKNFYYSIDHELLLESLDSYATKKSHKKLDFNHDKRNMILDFLYILMHEPKGLPVSNQNIISSAIADISINALDDYIYKLLNTNYNDWRYVRYVDDIFILIQASPFDDESRFNELISQISFFTANHLNLEMNSGKSKVIPIQSEEQLTDFWETTRIISKNDGFELQFREEKNHIEVIRKNINLVNDILSGDKKSLTDEEIGNLNKLFLMAFKERIPEVLNENPFSFDPKGTRNILIAPKQLLNFLKHDASFIDKLQKYIQDHLHKNFNDQSIFHFIEFLLVENKLSDNLKEQILSIKNYDGSNYFKLLRRSLSNESEIPSSLPPLKIPKVLYQKILPLSEQVQSLSMAEIKRDYCRCLNHLYNIVIEYSELIFPKPSNNTNYNINDVINNFSKNGISVSDTVKLKDLAFFRCNNGISHSGTTLQVTFDEYKIYKAFIVEFLNKFNDEDIISMVKESPKLSDFGF